MSKEHFWPDWLSAYISKGKDDKHFSEVHTSNAKRPAVLEKKIERSGNLITKKFRVVCKECNNGWMSKLEEKTKPLILALMESSSKSLSEDEIHLLSRWVFMKVAVAEQSEDGTQVTPSEDMRFFYKYEKIPEYFRIYIAHQNTEYESVYHRHAATLAFSKDGPSPPLNGMKRNTQSVSFIVGALFVYVTAARLDDFDLESYFSLQKLRRIFPVEMGVLDLDELEVLEKSDITEAIWSLGDLTSSAGVNYVKSLPK